MTVTFITGDYKKGIKAEQDVGVGMWALMLDDVNELLLPPNFPKPNIITQTSANSFQWLYIFRQILRDIGACSRMTQGLKARLVKLDEADRWADKDAASLFRNCRIDPSTNMKHEHRASHGHGFHVISVNTGESLYEFKTIAREVCEANLELNIQVAVGGVSLKPNGKLPTPTETPPENETENDGRITLYELPAKHDPLTQADIRRRGGDGTDNNNRISRSCLRHLGHRGWMNVKTGFVQCNRDGQSQCAQRHKANQEQVCQDYESKYKVKLKRPAKKTKGPGQGRVTEDEWLADVAKLNWQFKYGKHDRQPYLQKGKAAPELITGDTEDWIQVQIEREVGRPIPDHQHRKWRNAMVKEGTDYGPLGEWLDELPPPP